MKQRTWKGRLEKDETFTERRLRFPGPYNTNRQQAANEKETVHPGSNTRGLCKMPGMKLEGLPPELGEDCTQKSYHGRNRRKLLKMTAGTGSYSNETTRESYKES